MSENKTYISIDPGQKGAIAILKPHQKPIFYKMPLIEDEIDLIKLTEYISEATSNCHIIIEDVHSIFGASANSNYNFGFGCGQLFALLKLSGIPFSKVQPKQWQKEMWEGVKKVEVLDGSKKNKDGSPKYKTDTKATSLLAAIRLLPDTDFRATERSKIAHDGIVDALLMALYAKRKNY